MCMCVCICVSESVYICVCTYHDKYVITHKNEIVFVRQGVLFRKLPDCFVLYLLDFLMA